VNYKRFEELPVWQTASELCREVDKLIAETELKKDFSLKDQFLNPSIPKLYLNF
jgi:hypothetical protein